AIEAIYALAPMQEGMLFHTLQAPELDFYINTACYRFKGAIREDYFRRAWEKAIERHGILRTAFATGKKLSQVVFEHVPLPWVELDWRGMGEEEQKQRVGEYVREERRRGFQLERAPLFRLTLVRSGEEGYYFIWIHHHILLDGWSNVLVL